MNALIEDYLRTSGVRYFRGHHDEEYFFLVDFVYIADTHHGRLHVHLEACGNERDTVQISITPDRYYPAAGRDRLSALTVRWNADNPGSGALVHDSSDPGLVGMILQSRHRPADLAALTTFVDDTVAAAISLFGRVRRAVAEPERLPGELRDAG